MSQCVLLLLLVASSLGRSPPSYVFDHVRNFGNCVGPPERPSNGGVRITNNRFSLGSVVTYFCYPGYDLRGYNFNVCDGGSWRHIYPPSCVATNLCKNFPCGPRTICVNAPRSYTCKCKPGYIKHPTKPGCYETVCRPPKRLKNGKMFPKNKMEWRYGENVTYTCFTGFKLIGTKVKTCQNVNSFDHPPSCLARCSRPLPPSNGWLEPHDKPLWLQGDVVTYYCEGDFKLVGSVAATCGVRGTFDYKPPTCSAICLPPKPPLKGIIYPKKRKMFFEGDTVRYRCRFGTKLIGHNVITCTSSHMFKPHPPSCR